MTKTLSVRTFLGALRWIDGTPLLRHIEPYRLRLFERFFEERDAGRLRYNLGLFGRAKKNWKSADLILACYFALLGFSPGGSQVYIVANDEDQAGDNLELGKKLRKVNPLLAHLTSVKKNVIARKDGDGFIEILPAQDVIGSHGKTYRLLAVDEIHGHRTWDLLEALAPDPTRPDVQQWITSYASLYHRPGVPLFDLCQAGRAGTDARMLFSWYAADFTTDPNWATATPEDRANPSRASWNHPEYLAQQARRLPAHKFRRLHLNLPGLPEGSAFQPEPIMDAVARGLAVRAPEAGLSYHGFVDMSGGSNDDAVLGIAHQDAAGRLVLDRLLNQGPPPPFDPRAAVTRFVAELRAYRVQTVTGDRYAGLTFVKDFERDGFIYRVSERSASEIYEAFEPLVNAHRVSLLDVPVLEQQLLGLVWRGGKITHQSGEHDDYAVSVAGALLAASSVSLWSEADRLACLKAGRRGVDRADDDEDRAVDEGLELLADEVEPFDDGMIF